MASLEDALLSSTKLTRADLARAAGRRAEMGGHLETALLELGLMTERELAPILTAHYGLPAATADDLRDIPNGVKLTSYSGGSSDISTEQLQQYVELVEKGTLVIQTGPVFRFEELTQAHELMDANRAGGKIVVLGMQ